jgi:hypothetical protein
MTTSSQFRTSFKREHVFVGTTLAGHRVFVSGEVRRQPNPSTAQAIDHQEIEDPETLSLLSTVFKGKKNTSRNYEGGGATAPELRAIVKAAPGFTVAEARELRKIGEHWHLNTMRAGCAHMDLPDDESYDARKNITCPHTDYKYGAEWLVEPLTDEVRARFIELMSKGNTEEVDY